jgi:hypothetical protein
MTMKDESFRLSFMLCAALVGCGNAGDGSNDGTSPSSTPFEELYACASPAASSPCPPAMDAATS